MTALIKYWWVWVPAFLCVSEVFFPGSSKASPYFAAAAWRDQPLKFTELSVLSWTRVLSAYWLMALGVELALRGVPLKRIAQSPVVKSGLFLLGYAIFMWAVRIPVCPLAPVACLLGTLLVGTGAWLDKKPQDSMGVSVGLGLVLFFLLWIGVSAPKTWEVSAPPKAVTKTGLPSFFLVGFDSVAAPYFEMKRNDQYLTPRWHEKWAQQGYHFENAYTQINSSFGAWFSVLSGKSPYHNGVETAFPSRREGNEFSESLLPNDLRRVGYRTVFMTDCANPTFMKAEYGFEEMFQLGKGVFGCQAAYETSRHPLVSWFSGLGEENYFFPELNSQCSALQHPEGFWAAVEKKAKALAEDERPYLLAVHSCLTSPASAAELAVTDDAFEKHFQVADSARRDYFRRLRGMDAKLDALLSLREKENNRPWTFVFSDHGLKTERNEQGNVQLTYQSGDPVDRAQYQVPLAIFPPDPYPVKGVHRRDLVSLTDLRPTIARLMGQSLNNVDGRDLFSFDGVGRHLMLQSAIPLDPQSSALKKLLRDVRVTEEGALALAHESEIELLRSAPVAILQLPYQAVFSLTGAQLYDVEQDPSMGRDIAPFNSRGVQRLKATVCAETTLPLCSFNPRMAILERGGHRKTWRLRPN